MASSEPTWWRYRNDRQALVTLCVPLGEDAANGRVDLGWAWSVQDEIEAHLKECA